MAPHEQVAAIFGLAGFFPVFTVEIGREDMKSCPQTLMYRMFITGERGNGVF